MTSALMTVSEMRSFACWDDRVRYDGWSVARNFGTHRDADTVTASNWRVMLARLEALDPEYEAHGEMRASHWACGWYDHLLVDWRRIDLVCALEAMEREIDEYPLLDEDDHSMLECELHDDDACGEGCSVCEGDRQEHRYYDRQGEWCPEERECKLCKAEHDDDESED